MKHLACLFIILFSFSSWAQLSPVEVAAQTHFRNLFLNNGRGRPLYPSDLNSSFRYGNSTFRLSQFDSVIGPLVNEANMNSSDRRLLLQNYMVSRAALLRNEDQFNANFCQRDQRLCTAALNQRTMVRENIRTMFERIHGERRGTQLANEELACWTDDRRSAVGDVINILERAAEAAPCMPLEPGQYRMSNTRQQGSTRNFANQYLMRRMANGNFQAVLNLDFQSNGGSVSSEEMMTKTKACLRYAKPFLKGPQGEQLEVVVLSPQETQLLPEDQRPRAAAVDIRTTTAETFTTANNFEDSVDCPTITHEVLHHLGLCDEYRESRPELNQVTCRPVTNAVSIMNDSWYSYKMAIPRTNNCECNDVCQRIMRRPANIRSIYLGQNAQQIIPPTFYSRQADGSSTPRCTSTSMRPVRGNLAHPDKAAVWSGETATQFNVESRMIDSSGNVQSAMVTCPCVASDPTCRTVKDHVKLAIERAPRNSECPSYTGSFSPTTFTNADERRTRWGGSVIEPTVQGNLLRFSSEPVLNSILQPNQFNRILGGLCPNTAGAYHQCAEWAYRDASNGSCSTPQECRDSRVFNGTPARPQ